MAQAPADCASVNVRKIEVRPNQCRVDDALYLKIEFDLAAPLSNAAWEVKYILDTASIRHVIHLGWFRGLSYPQGSNEFVFQVEKVDVAGVKPSVLLNVGLLTVVLYSDDKELTAIKMVTQVIKRKDGALIRNILNPLE